MGRAPELGMKKTIGDNKEYREKRRRVERKQTN
jgi:hypothetical protein